MNSSNSSLLSDVNTFEKEVIKKFAKDYSCVAPFFNMFDFLIKLKDNDLILCNKNKEEIDKLEITKILKRKSITDVFEAKKIHFLYKREFTKNNDSTLIDDCFEFLKNGTNIYICSSTFKDDKRLYITIKNPEYFFEKIYITLTTTGISITASNLSSTFGNYRHFEYNDVNKVNGITNNFIEMYEKNGNDHISINLVKNVKGTYYMITKESSANFGDDISKKEVSKTYVENYSKQILASFRTKNLFIYILNILKNTLPGIINYMNNNYPNFKELCTLILRNSTTDSDINEFILSNTLAKCDFPSERKKRKNGSK